MRLPEDADHSAERLLRARRGALRIQPLAGERLRAEVARMRLAPHQHAYVSELDKVLMRRWWKADTTEYVACLDARVVGYFQLNFCPRETAHYISSPTAIGFEAFAIDLDWQGMGVGRRVLRALPDLVRARHPDYDRLNLTVNEDNLPGIRAYLATGFVDTGLRYLGGRSGPQHIFTLALAPAGDAPR
ncbi:MAG: GNAT family N-acetyltransferase [Gammaproteobacteria bacterium]|nr:GNAT family N-acetyltransferase [Gammaproteobacteria bacterium]